MIGPSRMALLRIRYEATSPGLVPAEVTIALDGARVHSGPTEEAFEHVAHVAPGRHTIEAAIVVEGSIEAELRRELDTGVHEAYRTQQAFDVVLRYRPWLARFACRVERG